MRKFFLGLLLGSLSATVLLAAPQLANQGETIRLGAELTLGMPEEAVVSKLAELYNLRKQQPSPIFRAAGVTSMWIADHKDGGTTIGDVSFSEGKLTYVRKDLLPWNGNEVDFGSQLYFVMRELETEGNSQCAIETKNTEGPEFSNKIAQFRCGKKTVVVDLQRFKGQNQTVQLYEELNAR